MFRRRVQVDRELAVLPAELPRRPPRVQGRLRQRLHAGGRRHDPRRRRQPDVPRARRRRAATTVQIFNTPLHQERAVTSTALYGQDSYSIGRLTIDRRHPLGARRRLPAGAAGARPAGSSLTVSCSSGVSINGVDAELHRAEDPSTRSRRTRSGTTGGRASRGTYDVSGNGKTVAEGVARQVSRSDQHRHAAQPERQHQPDLRLERRQRRPDLPAGQRDVERHPSTSAASSARSRTRATSPSPCSTRACGAPTGTSSRSALDHELFPDFLLEPDLPAHARARHRRATSTRIIDLWDSLFTPIHADRSGPRRRSSARATTSRSRSTTRTRRHRDLDDATINDDRLATRYDGIDIVGTKRYSRRAGRCSPATPTRARRST